MNVNVRLLVVWRTKPTAAPFTVTHSIPKCYMHLTGRIRTTTIERHLDRKYYIRGILGIVKDEPECPSPPILQTSRLS